MARLWLGVLIAVALGALAVAWLMARPPEPLGYSGLEFARVTGSAAARAPLLSTHGALIVDVAADSPADRAGIKPGAVVTAIDGVPITSARQASDIVRGHKKGGRMPKAAPKDERAIYDFVQELYKTRRVTDRTYKRVQSILGDAATVELVGILGYYALISMTLNIFRMLPPEHEKLAFAEPK